MMVDRRRLLVNGWSMALGAAALAGCGAPARVVIDPLTGFALSGYDPVTYFLHAEPRQGVAGRELRWSGASWRFENIGNMKAFEAAPNIYAPGLGGHDPVAATRGFVAEGDPRVYVIARDRLFLFHTMATRDLFAREPDGYITDGERNWTRLVGRLAR
jgi:hypothetical protein